MFISLQSLSGKEVMELCRTFGDVVENNLFISLELLKYTHCIFSLFCFILSHIKQRTSEAYRKYKCTII